MANLQKILNDNHIWVTDRIHTLCQDDENIEDAYALTREFDEWLNTSQDDHDIFSIEYIGEGSEYE